MAKPKFDLQSENFDLYFVKEVSKMNEHQKGQIPREYLFKLFKRNGTLNIQSSNKIGFLGKMYILAQGLGKKVFISVEDPEGKTIEEFSKLKTNLKNSEVTSEIVKEIIASGTFVLSGQELIKTISYLSHATASPLYNYLSKLKNVPKNKLDQWSEEIGYVMKFLTRYEGNKKKWMTDTGLNIQEFLILIALYNGEEIPGSKIMSETFKGSLYAGYTRMSLAMSSLQNKGLAVKYGVSKGSRMQITAAGKDVLNRVLLKII